MVEFENLKYDMLNNDKIDYKKIIEFMKSNIHGQSKFPEVYSMTRKYIPKMVFKYFSFTNDKKLNQMKLKTLSNKSIYLSSNEYLNDPFDTKAFFYDEKKLREFEVSESHGENILENVIKNYVLTCFTSNGVSCMPMWAHYSNNHNGYCVSYKTDIPFNNMLYSTLMPVQYIDSRIDITDYMVEFASGLVNMIKVNSENGIKKHLVEDWTLPYMAAFYSNLKHFSWSYENELRCCVGKRFDNDTFMDALPSAIYVGVNCCEENRKHLIDIGDYYGIKVYDMKFDNNALEFVLKPELISIN